MTNNQTYSNSSNYIDPVSIEAAIKLLEKKKMSETEIYKLIATLGKMIGLETYTTKYLPKGKIIIGTGKNVFSQFDPIKP